MTPRSNIITDDEGVWIILDPQNREEWEAFWATLLPLVEDQAVEQINMPIDEARRRIAAVIKQARWWPGEGSYTVEKYAEKFIEALSRIEEADAEGP